MHWRQYGHRDPITWSRSAVIAGRISRTKEMIQNYRSPLMLVNAALIAVARLPRLVTNATAIRAMIRASDDVESPFWLEIVNLNGEEHFQSTSFILPRQSDWLENQTILARWR